MSINKFFSYTLLFISFALIFNLGRDILRLKKAEQRITHTKDKLDQVKRENQKLNQTKEHYQTDQFLEEQIRNKLHLAKPGETIVILPPELQLKTNKEAESLLLEPQKEYNTPNWEKWLNLFK